VKVLIVEDEHKIANSIKQGLIQENFNVDVAYDGTEGYDLAVAEEYDVIILDRLLPGMEGLGICKKLREQKNHTPILILTARGQITDRVEGLEGGADDYLIKPFAFEELLARIKALARRPKKTQEAIIEIADLSLNTKTFEVKRDNVHIQLSSKEFSLLEYLMRHSREILTKDKIISHVWNYESNILPNTIEVYVGYLRNKIDKPFKKSPKLIHTIRGFGYKIGSAEKN
jgi:two-component system, OmpR family, response regulator